MIFFRDIFYIIDNYYFFIVSNMQPWLLAMIIILCVLLVAGLVLFIRWWRARQHLYSNAQSGLPYHIELEDDQFSIDQY